MEFKDKINQSVAAAVAKIMGEALHPNQQKIDVVDDEKIDGKDFAKLRKMKKEEVERIDELSIGKLIDIKHAANKVSRDARSDSDDARAEKADRVAGTATHKAEMKYRAAGLKPSGQHKLGEESHQSKTTMKHIPNASPALKKAAKDIKPGVSGYQDRVAMLKAGNVKEEVEELDEVKMADLPSTKVQGRSYGASKPQPSAFDVLKGPKDKELKSIETEKKKPVKEDIELTLDDYLLEELVEFVMSEEFQQLDELSKSTLGSYVTKASKDMRSHSQMAGSKDTALMAHQMGYRRGEKSPIKGGTKGEKRVSSEIAKHQTKANNRTAGIAGAAQRLAKEQFEITEEDAYDKNVKPSDKPHDKDAAKKRAQTSAVAARKIMSMSSYSAKKNAIKEETESEHYKAGHEYASDHAQDSGFKVTARARKKEMLADNPHKKGTKEHTDWHQGALHGHQTALENM